MSNNYTINILIYNGSHLINKNMTKFIEIIYKNFNHIADVTKLNHTREEINRLLKSDTSIIVLSVIDNKIIGYLIADIISLENLKQMLHISYLFTSPTYRNIGIATTMINSIEKYALDRNINTLSLTLNTYNKYLERFYFDNNFTYDSNLRTHKKYDIMVKYI